MHPPQVLGWFRRQIKALENLKGVKMRFLGPAGKVTDKPGMATQPRRRAISSRRRNGVSITSGDQSLVSSRLPGATTYRAGTNRRRLATCSLIWVHGTGRRRNSGTSPKVPLATWLAIRWPGGGRRRRRQCNARATGPTEDQVQSRSSTGRPTFLMPAEMPGKRWLRKSPAQIPIARRLNASEATFREECELRGDNGCLK